MTSPLSRRRLLVAGGATAAALALGGGAPAVAAGSGQGGADLVAAWNRTLLRILRTPGAQPATVHPTRSFAMLHTAVHDAVVAAGRAGRPALLAVDAPRSASPVAAAAQAAHDVLTGLYPAFAGALDAQLATDLATVPDGRAKTSGVLTGQRIARLIAARRANDGSGAIPPVLPPGTEPGRYRPTPPAFAPAVFTHWAAVTPFVLDRADRFRPGPYPPLTSAAYAEAVNEVARLGQDTSTARTADQTVQARFWAAPIWNYWNEIAQSVVLGAPSGLPTAARVFAELNLAFADAVIAFYDAKYHYRIWRPITAIRLADTDGNPATIGDPNWTSLGVTPADPAYPGAHSVIAQAGAEILRHEYGPCRDVTVTSEVLPGTVRAFGSFQDISDEAGTSRLFAGVHTRLDHNTGRRLGHDVAHAVLDA
ncbi:vanadium-dependent haloperoxidase [Amycolatopsis sp. NPDC059027]|uniref:vanadium-dependent haloperoxidase n=1 Tax=Amycolatopsis sp. NPDC059027 TaxID=3346709 RepID=UPI00366C57D8